MIDLGFSGPRFTWLNRRGVSDLIQERINRFFVNPGWYNLFPKARVMHLTCCFSDHCPVLMESKPKPLLVLERPFKFQSFWASDPSFPSVVSNSWSNLTSLPEAIKLIRTIGTRLILGIFLVKRRS